MICFCRLLHRAFSANCRKNGLGTFSLQSSAAVRSHSRCFSLENPEILSEEKSIVAQASFDMKRSETIYQKQRKFFQSFLEKCFSKNEFSSSYVVSFLRTTCDETCSQELVYGVLKAIDEFQTKSGIQLSLSIDQKITVLNSLSCYKYYSLLPLACSIFKLRETAESLKEFLDYLVQNKKFSQAAFCIGALNLQQKYDIENIAVPLLSEGKISPVILCISNCPDTQLKVAQKLDSLLVIASGKTDSKQFLNTKIIFKSLSSIVNTFKIPPEQCKNLHFIRGRAAINILLKKKYEHSVSYSTWEEMVMSIISGNPLLKEHLIFKLVLRKDFDEALKMVSKLDMQDYDVASLMSEMENDSVSETDGKLDDEEICDEKCDIEEPGHLTISLDASDIHFIDTKEKFYKCISDITQNYKFVGVDSEWKPNFGLSHDRLALIQLAVHDKVYIIDMIALNDCLKNEVWDRLIDDIFASPQILKLGCGIMFDVQMIVDSNKENDGKVMRFSHILDMAVFYQKLQEVYPDHFEVFSDNPKNTIGLSKLCEIFLGKSLNKEERLCDWEKRPLTESQLEYAALDAHCLLQIYDVLKQKAIEKDIRFEHMVNVALVLTNGLAKPKRKLKQVKSEKGFKILKPIPINMFKVVVDYESEQLGKQLRKLGADVVTLCSSDTPETAIQISNSEDRILICSESLWNLVQDKISHSFCTNSDDLEDKVSISHIIKKFNVMLKTKYMLSPCLICNSEDGLQLSPEKLNMLHEWSSKNTSIQESDSSTSSFHKILIEMSKSGIDIKFNQTKNASPSSQMYLCTKCGTVQ